MRPAITARVRKKPGLVKKHLHLRFGRHGLRPGRRAQAREVCLRAWRADTGFRGRCPDTSFEKQTFVAEPFMVLRTGADTRELLAAGGTTLHSIYSICNTSGCCRRSRRCFGCCSHCCCCRGCGLASCCGVAMSLAEPYAWPELQPAARDARCLALALFHAKFKGRACTVCVCFFSLTACLTACLLDCLPA